MALEKRVPTIRNSFEDRPPDGFSPVHRDYHAGDVERVFTLSEDTQAERIEAKFRNGVPRVSLPRAGPAQTTRIQVQTG